MIKNLETQRTGLAVSTRSALNLEVVLKQLGQVRVRGAALLPILERGPEYPALNISP